MRFYYVAVNSNGIKIRGSTEANTIDEAKKNLEALKHTIISINKRTFFSTWSKWFSNKKLSTSETIIILTHIATLDKVGLPIINIMEILKNDVASSRIMKSFCNNVYRELESGNTLYQSMLIQDAIDPLVPMCMRAAESSGNYSTITSKTVELLQTSNALHVLIKSTIIRVSASLLTIMGLLMIMSKFVIPQIIGFLTENDITIPWYTALLMKFSGYISTIIIIIFTLIALITIFAMILKRSKALKYHFDKAILSLPVLGDIMIKKEASRFCSFLTIMYSAGEHVENIVEDLSKSTNNAYISEKLHQMASLMKTGTTIEKAIYRVNVFPEMANKMISIALSSNNVADIMANAISFMDQEIRTKTAAIVDGIKPLTMIIMGVLVTWMAMSVFSPIYNNIANMASNMNNGI